MGIMLAKSTGIWLIFIILAIVNGMLREYVLVPYAGASIALPLSGILLGMFIFLVTFALIPWVGSTDPKVYVLTGILWVALTLFFEFPFGHFVMGKPWREIMQVFNIMRGNLFVVVLGITAVSPWVAARLRGIL